MEKTSLLVMLFISFPEAMFVVLLGLLVLGFKPTLKQILLFGFFEAIVSYFILNLSLPFGIHSLLQFISFSLIIYLVMFIPYKLSLLATLISFSIYASLEALYTPLFFNLTGFSYTAYFNNFWIRLVFFLPKGIFLTLIILLVTRFDMKLAKFRELIFKINNLGDKNQPFQINKSFHLIILFLTQYFLIVLFYLVNIDWINEGAISKNTASVPVPVMLIIAVLPVVAIVLIKRVVALINSEVETRTQLEALRHVEELLNTIRSQRHNFSHELQVAYGLLEVEAFQEAKNYIKSSMAEIAAASELVKTDNLGITALLQTKTGLAEARKIKLSIEVKTSLKELPLETREANIILGNLIDNAIEAVNELPPEQRYVEVILSQEMGNYVFEVKNCGTIEPELVGKIFEPGFSTKKEGRGMGLYSIERLVNKYNGKIDVASSTEVTGFKVFIPHKR